MHRCFKVLLAWSMPAHPNTDLRAPSAIWRAGSWRTRCLVFSTLMLSMLSGSQCVVTAEPLSPEVMLADLERRVDASLLLPRETHTLNLQVPSSFYPGKAHSKTLSQAHQCLCDHSCNYIHRPKVVHTKIPLQKAPTDTASSLHRCICTSECTNLLYTTEATAKRVGLAIPSGSWSTFLLSRRSKSFG